MKSARTDYISYNKYTRPKWYRTKTEGIIMHYTANPGATASGHKGYFDGLTGRYASAHIFVDREEAVLIIPLNEVTFHANDKQSFIKRFRDTSAQYYWGSANLTTVGIEMCLEDDGSIHPKTVARAEKVAKELMKIYNLKSSDVYRHYDVTGKYCPAHWVKDGSKFADFKQRLDSSKVIQVSNSISDSSSERIGTVKIVSRRLNVRKSASFKSKVVKVLKKGKVYKVYGKKNGLYNVGKNQWVSANEKYVEFTPDKVKSPVPTSFLRKGDSGKAVKDLQKALVSVYFYPEGNLDDKGVDGYFGAKTEDALRRFQSIYTPSDVDGLYGEKTQKALAQQVNK